MTDHTRKPPGWNLEHVKATPSGHLVPETGAQWRAVLDDAGLQHIPNPTNYPMEESPADFSMDAHMKEQKLVEQKQCKSCPWRVDCEPLEDIPGGYSVELHKKLRGTIQSGLESMAGSCMRVMACHYSKPGEEFPCAGWVYNQIGPGNNIGVRLRVMSGAIPVPIVDGEQHETFEDTLPDENEDEY